MKVDSRQLRFSEPNMHVFFGYYDVSPLNSDNKLLLSTHLPIDNDQKVMKVGYYRLSDELKEFNEIGQTETWCWQQGCRLRWIDEKNLKVIYNTMINSDYGSIIYDIKKDQVIKKIKKPIYDLNKEGTLGASLNFSRLQRLRPGYGYSNKQDQFINQKNPEEDGLFLVDINENKSNLIVSLDEISKISARESMVGCDHYLNHIFFSPDSKYLFFFHLWSNKLNRDARLFRYEIESKQLKLIVDNTISHYAWKSLDTFLVTEFTNDTLSYNLYNIDGSRISTIGANSLNQDGHPSFSMESNFIISDTYPNYFGYQKLFKYDIESTKLTDIAKFYTNPSFTGEKKCDLHPRLSMDNKFICVDAVDSGKREMVLLDIK